MSLTVYDSLHQVLGETDCFGLIVRSDVMTPFYRISITQ